MEEGLAAQGFLVEYMDARWMTDTLGAILKRYYRNLPEEAKYLIFADLQYLDPGTHGIILDSGSDVAERQLGAQYAAEVSNMEKSKEKLMRHDLVMVSTIGQMKTLIKLKRENYKWDFAVTIRLEVEEIGFGVEGYNEAEGHIRELANRSLIPVLNPQQVVQTTFSPDPPQTSDETRDETPRLEENNPKVAAMEEDGDDNADWEEDIEADAPKENIAAMEEDGHDNADWGEDIEADAPKENIAAMEENGDDDIDWGEDIEADALKENIAAMEENGDDDIDWGEDIEADAPKENIAAMEEEEEEEDDDIDWEEG